MKLRTNIKQFMLILLIPLLIITIYICMLQYSKHLSRHEKEIGLHIHKQEIWTENIKKILVSDADREKIKDCLRCSLAGGHLSSEDSACIVESRCDCVAGQFCDCPGATRYVMKELQKWHPEVSHLERLQKEDVDRCFR